MPAILLFQNGFAETENASKQDNTVDTTDSIKVHTLLSVAEKYFRTSPLNCDSAKGYTDNALAIAQKSGYTNGIARAYYFLGRIANNCHRSFDTANSLLLKSLTIFENNKDANGIAECHLQLGVISYSLQNYLEAETHFEKCIENVNVSERTLTIGNYLLALTYSETNKIMLALNHFNVALEGYNKLNDNVGIVQCNTYIGKMYLNIGGADKAVQKLTETIDFARKKNIEPSTLQRSYAFLATGYLKQRNYARAVYYGELALHKNNDFLTRKEALSTLGQAYAKLGKYNEAYKNVNNLRLLIDSIYNSNIVKNIFELRSKYDYEKMLSLEKTEQEKVMAKQEAETDKQKLKGNATLAIAILIFILLLVLFNRYRLKQNHNTELTHTLDTLKRTQQQLVQHEKLASLGSLTAGIAHEIKNPLNFVTNFSQISNELVDEFVNAKTDTERKEIGADLKTNLQKINQHGKRADSIVHSMLQHARSNTEKNELVNLNELCNEYIDLSYQAVRANFSDFNCTIKKNYDHNLPNVSIIRQSISRVILNLINNALFALRTRATSAAPKSGYMPILEVSTYFDAVSISIKIEDNGIGIPEEIKHKIFEPFFTTKPTGEGTGLGLSICFDIIKTHRGILTMESSENNFTEFIVSLPLQKG